MDDYQRRFAIQQEADKLIADEVASITYKGARLAIRLARVVTGLALAMVAFIIWGATPSISDTPFAALTFGQLGGAVFGIGFAVLFFYWAFWTAFGAGPSKEDLRNRFLDQATRNLDRAGAKL